jgi:outer membrane protein OmpA-like peptidoglycan-associated protein
MVRSTHPWIVAAALGIPSVAAAEPVSEPPPETTEPTPEVPAPEPEPEPEPKVKAGGKGKAGGKAKLGGGAEASGSSDSSSETSGAAGADGSADSSVRYTERGRERDESKWIHRWAPQAGMGEIGIYGGVWFPSRHLELYAATQDAAGQGNQLLRLVAPDVGLRAGYYPLRYLGVEVEGGAMPTRTLDSGNRATAWNVRGHVVAQLGLWSVTPFMLVGTGVLGMASDAAPNGIGTDQDVEIHFGGGVKVYVNRLIQLRLDVRDVVSNRQGVGDGLTSSPEILLGLSLTLGRKKDKQKARPGAGDKDGDRILDRDDYCPDVFGEAPRGCPQVCIDDSDGDGLSNPVDKCPTEPETRNGFKEADGCPDEVPPELGDLSGVMEGITFDTDKDAIKSGSKPRIDRAVEVMKKYPELKVRVSGHTDSQGPYRHNVDLSKRRAKAVKGYMVESGIDESRIETEGFGPDQPIDTNETVEGRSKNRRIEFTIIQDTEGVEVTTSPEGGGGETPVGPEPAAGG